MPENAKHQEEWLEERYQGKFDSMNFYSESKLTVRALRRLGCYDSVLGLFGACCNLAEPSLRNKDLVFTMRALVVLFR